jgi:translation initiation factor 2 alpha subunit (eIF-2alpha)
MEYEQGDTLLCTVDRIMGTTVFVTLPNGKEGTIILSEIAPGRIRNLRDHVVPKKSIVCKVLRAFGETVHLSLRRVTLKEKKEVLEQAKQEKSYKAILKTILKEDAKQVIEKIKEVSSVYDFLQNAKDPKGQKELEKIAGKENAKKIIEIVSQQKQKKFTLKKKITISSEYPNGLELIKELFSKINKKEYEVKYISAGKYSIKKETSDLKKSDKELKEVLENLEKFAKKNHMEISIK